ncbi:MAG: hypothetical protein WCG34_08945 [Leptolinea sp.]
MTERKNMNNLPLNETSLSVVEARGKNRAVMNLVSMAGFNERQELQISLGNTLANMIKHPPMPDGTGQIINIGA